MDITAGLQNENRSKTDTRNLPVHTTMLVDHSTQRPQATSGVANLALKRYEHTCPNRRISEVCRCVCAF